MGFSDSVASRAAVVQGRVVECVKLASWLHRLGVAFPGCWWECAYLAWSPMQWEIGHTELGICLDLKPWDSHTMFPVLESSAVGGKWCLRRVCCFGGCPRDLELCCFLQAATFSLWVFLSFGCLLFFFSSPWGWHHNDQNRKIGREKGGALSYQHLFCQFRLSLQSYSGETVMSWIKSRGGRMKIKTCSCLWIYRFTRIL